MARAKVKASTAESIKVADKEPVSKSQFRIVEKGGKFILYHGGSVRQVFMTRAKAEEYMEWCSR